MFKRSSRQFMCNTIQLCHSGCFQRGRYYSPVSNLLVFVAYHSSLWQIIASGEVTWLIYTQAGQETHKYLKLMYIY